MLRTASWLAFALFPLLSVATILAAHDLPVWRLFLSAGVPVAIVEGIRSHWWLTFVGLVAAHYCFFTLHPLFNRTLRGWQAKFAWAGSNLVFYPIVPPIYAWLRTGNARS